MEFKYYQWRHFFFLPHFPTFNPNHLNTPPSFKIHPAGADTMTLSGDERQDLEC